MMWVYLLHLRHSIFKFVVPVIFVAAGALAWNGVYVSVASHANITNTLVSTSAVISPVLAGFAAWDGLREGRNGGGAVLSVAVQPRTRIALVQVTAGASYALGVYLALVVLLYGRALALGLPLMGDPLWMNLLIPPTVLVISALIGYTASLVVDHWAAVVLAAAIPVTVYGFSLFGAEAGLLYDLTPFGNRAGGDFLDPNTPFFVGQWLFLLGLIALFVGVMGLCSKRDRLVGTIAGVLAVGFGISGVMLVDRQEHRWGNIVADIEQRLTPFSTADGALTLNLLPTYAPVADELLATWARVQSLVRESPLAFEELSQLSEGHPQQSPDGRPFEVIYLNPTSTAIRSESVMASLIDVHSSSCDSSMTFETILVQFWLAGEEAAARATLMPEHEELLARLRALDDKAGRVWFAAHADAFVHCAVTGHDFPHA